MSRNPARLIKSEAEYNSVKNKFSPQDMNNDYLFLQLFPVAKEIAGELKHLSLPEADDEDNDVHSWHEVRKTVITRQKTPAEIKQEQDQFEAAAQKTLKLFQTEEKLRWAVELTLGSELSRYGIVSKAIRRDEIAFIISPSGRTDLDSWLGESKSDAINAKYFARITRMLRSLKDIQMKNHLRALCQVLAQLHNTEVYREQIDKSGFWQVWIDVISEAPEQAELLKIMQEQRSELYKRPTKPVKVQQKPLAKKARRRTPRTDVPAPQPAPILATPPPARPPVPAQSSAAAASVRAVSAAPVAALTPALIPISPTPSPSTSPQPAPAPAALGQPSLASTSHPAPPPSPVIAFQPIYPADSAPPSVVPGYIRVAPFQNQPTARILSSMPAPSPYAPGYDALGATLLPAAQALNFLPPIPATPSPMHKKIVAVAPVRLNIDTPEFETQFRQLLKETDQKQIVAKLAPILRSYGFEVKGSAITRGGDKSVLDNWIRSQDNKKHFKRITQILHLLQTNDHFIESSKSFCQTLKQLYDDPSYKLILTNSKAWSYWVSMIQSKADLLSIMTRSFEEKHGKAKTPPPTAPSYSLAFFPMAPQPPAAPLATCWIKQTTAKYELIITAGAKETTIDLSDSKSISTFIARMQELSKNIENRSLLGQLTSYLIYIAQTPAPADSRSNTRDKMDLACVFLNYILQKEVKGSAESPSLNAIQHSVLKQDSCLDLLYEIIFNNQSQPKLRNLR